MTIHRKSGCRARARTARYHHQPVFLFLGVFFFDLFSMTLGRRFHITRQHWLALQWPLDDYLLPELHSYTSPWSILLSYMRTSAAYLLICIWRNITCRTLESVMRLGNSFSVSSSVFFLAPCRVAACILRAVWMMRVRADLIEKDLISIYLCSFFNFFLPFSQMVTVWRAFSGAVSWVFPPACGGARMESWTHGGVN